MELPHFPKLLCVTLRQRNSLIEMSDRGQSLGVSGLV